jgi:adenosylcobinamide-GDP ribazoletransferase
MSPSIHIRRGWFDLLAAVQFLTRLQVPSAPYAPDTLARGVKFFPIVGLLVGLGSALLYFLLAPHLPSAAVGLLIVVYLVFITGCLHEDGLADTADGLGGEGEREKVLAVMRDSRIGTYGAAALTLSLLSRVLLIASLPKYRAEAYLIASAVLCRWTTLPLSFYLSSARDRDDGQGARIARLTTRSSLVIGSILALGIVFAILRVRALIPVLATMAVTFVTALYYKRRIGGITGDCFGATNQLAEVAVYLCGAWT